MRATAGLLLLPAACAPGGPTEPVVPDPFTAEEVERILRLSPLPPLPPDPTNAVADDPAAARLGQRLFFDERLSRDGDRSCASCHDPAEAFTDAQALAEGLRPLERHTPSLINVAHHRWYFWDGRADSLWAQALVPLESPLEHASSRLQVAHVVAGDPLLRTEYEEVFGPLPPLEDGARFPPTGRPVPADDHAHRLAAEHAAEARSRGDGRAGGHQHGEGSDFYHPHQRAWDGMTPEDREAVTRVFVNVGKALAAYQRRLVTGNAPFDRFVAGLRDGDPEKLAALDASARRGLKLFLGRGNCHFCHGGPLLSDLEFHDLGLPGDDPGRSRGLEALRRSEFVGTGRWSDEPEGRARFQVGQLPRHRHPAPEFRTPSLRNVTATAPYMHDGRLATLEEVVAFYSTLEEQRDHPPPGETILEPLALTEREQADLVAFLESLTDLEVDPTLARPIE